MDFGINQVDVCLGIGCLVTFLEKELSRRMKLPCVRHRHPHPILWISWPTFTEQ